MRFILTKELGKLARWLRILGFDTLYYKDDNLGTLIIEALRDNRIVITRTKKLDYLKVKIVVVDSQDIYQQLKEVKEKLKFSIDEGKMFTRCTVCNAPLLVTEKKKVKDNVPAYVYKTQKHFMRCQECKKVYWRGSHWGNVRKAIEAVKS